MITLPHPTILESAAIAGAEAAHHLATVINTQPQQPSLFLILQPSLTLKA